jgi:hypothetical protein
MRVQPQCPGRDGRINPGAPPPCGFIAAAVDLTMVSPTQWDSEFIAHLASERPALHKSEVVGIRGASATNQTGVLGNEFDVIPITKPARL